QRGVRAEHPGRFPWPITTTSVTSGYHSAAPLRPLPGADALPSLRHGPSVAASSCPQPSEPATPQPGRRPHVAPPAPALAAGLLRAAAGRCVAARSPTPGPSVAAGLWAAAHTPPASPATPASLLGSSAATTLARPPPPGPAAVPRPILPG